MQARPTLTSVLFVTALGLADTSTAQTITVVGQDDVTVDRQNVQDAVDAATSGTTIELVGTFRFDGERVRLDTKTLTIVGESVDNDDDGQTQEDWVDGRDNDDDGLVDEDDWETLLIGVEGDPGLPATDDGVNGLFNRGFVVDGIEGVLIGLTIRDLAFSTFHRAVELIPEWDSPSGNCDDRTEVDGSVRGLAIEHNRFSNNVLGITLLGATNSSSVKNNVFVDNEIFGVVLEGGTVDCPLSGGGSVELALRAPRLNRIVDNRSFDAPIGTSVTFGSLVAHNELEESGIFTLSDGASLVSQNTVVGGAFGLVVDGGKNVLIERNRISDVFEGIIADGAADRVLVVSNEASALFIGLDVFGSGFRAADNTLSGQLFVDLLLDVGSSQNKVVNLGDAITAIDDGTDNQLIGNFIFP